MRWLEAGRKRQSQSVPFSFVNYFFVCRNMGIQFRGQLVGVKSSIPLCGSHRWRLSGLTAGILAHTGLSCGFSLQPMFARASEDGPDSCPPDYPAEGLGHHVWTFRIPHKPLSTCLCSCAPEINKTFVPRARVNGNMWREVAAAEAGDCELAHFCSPLIHVLTHGSKTSTPSAATPGIVRLACSETFCAAWYRHRSTQV